MTAQVPIIETRAMAWSTLLLAMLAVRISRWIDRF